jgi:transcriptional regulator of arginine metabolism
MTTKRDRLALIRELIDENAVGSQEELRLLLEQRGLEVTQSTLSRDLRELRVARVQAPEGARYTIGLGAEDDDNVGALDAVLPPLFRSVDGVGEMVVLKTVVGGAQPVAVALDSEDWPDILGTLGGDDTILIICRSADARERVTRKLSAIARGPAPA